MATDAPVIIVGAGPAGLSVGACLRRAGVDFLMLEREGQIASSWRRHYDRLHLHTPKEHSGLPFVPFPKSYPRYPSRLQVIEYLEDYARRFDLHPRFQQEVKSYRKTDGQWQIETADSVLTSRYLVVATGFNAIPARPLIPGLDQFEGTVLHSAEYWSGEAFAGQRVLVVGFGNSGGEIALDLWEQGARPDISARSPVSVVPRDLFGIPISVHAILYQWLPPRLTDRLNVPTLRLVLGDLEKYGIQRSPMGPAEMIATKAKVPVIDVGTIPLIKQGCIAVRPGVAEVTERGAMFTDGTTDNYDVLILATGFRTGLESMFGETRDGVMRMSDAGRPQAIAEDLWFCGFNPTAPGLLREIGIEAKRIASRIKHLAG